MNLANARQRAAHIAAKPTVLLPDNERKRPLPLVELPRICQKSTITLRPDDLGIKDKLRQGHRTSQNQPVQRPQSLGNDEIPPDQAIGRDLVSRS